MDSNNSVRDAYRMDSKKIENLKAFHINDTDTVIAHNEEEAIQMMADLHGYDGSTYNGLVLNIDTMVKDMDIEVREFTDEELVTKKVYLADIDDVLNMEKEDRDKLLVSYKEYIKRIKKGEFEAPTHFTSEY